MPDLDILAANRKAWNLQSEKSESPWVQPVGATEIEAAREGRWSVILTPNRPVPREWFGELGGRDVLTLASGGGQQSPILAAAGARVTSYDLSDEQLAKDQRVADLHGLDLRTIRGDMADLAAFGDDAFDLIFHPVSNVFAPEVRPVWRECARVLRRGGRLLAGFMNPDFFLFDHDDIERGGNLEVRFALPYRDPEHLSIERIEARQAEGAAVEFSHSLDDQIGGQIDAGFVIRGFYEDRWNEAATPLDRFMPTSLATLAILP